MRLLGIDIGDKRIGLAVSDKEENIAVPLMVLENDPGINQKLESLIIEYNIGKIIVGLPYTLKGEIGEQAKKVISFVEADLAGLSVGIDYEDERFTSRIPIIKKGKDKKKYIDNISASLILQSYLDRRKNKIDTNK